MKLVINGGQSDNNRNDDFTIDTLEEKDLSSIVEIDKDDNNNE